MIGRTCQPNTQPEINLPLRRQIQIDRGKNLVLLLADRIKTRNRANGAIIFKPPGNLRREIVAEFKIQQTTP